MSGTVQHGPESEIRQRPEADEWWQDSAFVVFHAAEAGIGGVMRIGHEPNHAGGVSALWFGLVTDDGQRYRRNAQTLLTPADLRDDGFGARDGAYRITYDDRVRYRVSDEDVELELEVEDFYPRTDFFPASAGTLVDDFASSHYESSGAIRGEIVLGGRRYEVDGLCHRDHSWGLRRWDQLLNHRWIPGTVGPELSFGSISWHGADGSLRQFGYVVRDGVVEHASEVDVAVTIEADGVSPRSAQATWTFADGSGFEVACTPIDGVAFAQHEVVSIDNICAVEIEGKRGFCDLELSTNPRGGTGPLTLALRAANVDGLSHR